MTRSIPDIGDARRVGGTVLGSLTYWLPDGRSVYVHVGAEALRWDVAVEGDEPREGLTGDQVETLLRELSALSTPQEEMTL
ncbi:hypothetical protein JNW90_10660 [Micromonospora sp. STR1s_5]|nr:hypothetical protein [Micromonospora sp. STR1s_5]